ncbi:hypothetical protein J6TS1_42880 [Siminovitchia terrae]|uniref:Uncharacterized protein n=1 Tax=Siminovitchia terrae TaxID=1914933 RepID=A0A429XAW2_SIMTE|nr:hypothetical protein [Siminovitchia terrae]RST60577.1 hypothetical protein D5F11_007035 [Siminovitchia terrae]GIN93140.1 hypothetical protein J22TS1_41910 [Siminovitchia terrae]GIN98418.1 hypothetical protein J6TS1_42880 [Siminovitchia terrae]
MILLLVISFLIGVYLIGSAILLVLRETKNKRNSFWDFLVIVLDVISDPITSEGMRIFFGGVFIAIAILLLVI